MASSENRRLKEEIEKLFAPFIVSRRVINGKQPQGEPEEGTTVGSNRAAELAGMTISAFQSALQSGRVRGAYRVHRQVGCRPVWVIPLPVVVDPPKRKRNRWTKPQI